MLVPVSYTHLTQGHSGGGVLLLGKGPGQIRRSSLPGVHRQVHAIAKLRTVFKERVFPSRSSPLLIDCIGRGGGAATPNGGAAGGVGNVHPVTKKLCHQLDIGCLTAPGTSPGELKEGLLELTALHGLLGKGKFLSLIHILMGAIPAALLAFILGSLIDALQRKVVPKGMRKEADEL